MSHSLPIGTKFYPIQGKHDGTIKYGITHYTITNITSPDDYYDVVSSHGFNYHHVSLQDIQQYTIELPFKPIQLDDELFI